MSEFSININDAQLEPVFQRMLQWLRQQPGIEVVEQSNGYEVKASGRPNRMIPGPPMTQEEFEEEIRKGEADIAAGNVYTTEQLLNEIKKW